MKGVISMSIKETERITVMDNLIARRIKQKHAAKQLGITVRQVQRIIGRYRKEGAAGLVHRSRGRISNRAIPDEKEKEIISLIKKYYPDFGPTLACEKLEDIHNLSFSDETIRKIMTEENLWLPKKKKAKDIHPYRERRACLGELVQLDGSPHKWFEDRVPACTLVAFIDDATSRIMDGCFVAYEGTFTLFEATEHYLKTHGKPLIFYVDKHSTFKINRQANIEEDLKDKQAQSQFARAMDELAIEVIFANSPEAKGRIERLFETLQDRLVKEMRLKGISNKKEATRFFREEYIPFHNSRFAVPAKEKANLHRPLLPTDDLEKIFTIQSKRLVSKDLNVRYKNTRYQLQPVNGYRYTLRHTAVTVVENRKGKVSFMYKDKTIPNKIAVKEVQHVKPVQVVSSKDFTEQRIRIPEWNHPWRQMGRLQIELAKKRHKRENEVAVLTENGRDGNNQVIAPV